MKKVIERIVESPGAPNENDLWLNGTTLKKFQNGEWVAISGGNSGGDGDSDSDIQMTVVGVNDDGFFVPNAGQPSYAEAKAHFLAGGLVYFRYGNPMFGTNMSLVAENDDRGLLNASGMLIWSNPDYNSGGGGGDPV